MAKVLVSDPVSDEGLEVLKQSVEVDYLPDLTQEQLIAKIGDYEALMVRSKSKVTAEVINAGTKLRIIGRAGVGVDNIDVNAATQRGIVVVNSPEGNTIAAAELAFALMLALARKIPQADASLRSGEWERNKFIGTEVYKKTLGIVGMGRIGTEVAKRAKAFRMTVIAHDPFLSEERAAEIGVEPVSLDDLYKRSDFITLHVPKTPETAGMINAKSISMMKNGVRIINAARGGIIDEEALANAIKSEKVAGAALDVFSNEPPSADLELISLSQDIVTPHLGASTEEAQVLVAVDVAEQIVAVLSGGVARSPVNLPAMSPDIAVKIGPYLNLAEKMGSMLAQLAREPVISLNIKFAGDWIGLPTDTVTRAALAGLLGVQLDETVNLVNAPILANQRGIKWSQTVSPREGNYSTSLEICVKFPMREHCVSGAVFGRSDCRITHIDGFAVDIVPEGFMLITSHRDTPGMIGKVGTILGDKGINIARMHVGREVIGGRAITALQVDEEVPPATLNQIRQIQGMDQVVLVTL